MSTPSTFHAGFGSRLKNSQDLIQTIKALLLYNPIVDAIKIAIYEPFVSSVAAAMEPYNTAFKNFKQQENLTEDVFLLIVAITRKVREALLEIYLDSKEYHDYNELLDVITADQKKHLRKPVQILRMKMKISSLFLRLIEVHALQSTLLFTTILKQTQITLQTKTILS